MEEDEDSFELEVFEVDEPATPDEVSERRTRRHRRRRRAKSFGSAGPTRSRSSVSVCSSEAARGDQPLVPPATPETPGGAPEAARPTSTFRSSLLNVLGKLVIWRSSSSASARHRAPPTPPHSLASTQPPLQPPQPEPCEYLRGFLAIETERRIRANDREFNAQFHYANNLIKTSKYSVLTFLPLNLFEQFQRLANFYFLCLLVLQMIPAISSLTPVTTAVPLIGVLALTAVKDAYDDYQRHVSDSQVNNRKSLTLRDGKLVEEKWAQVQVGDVIRMENDQFVAADMLLLSTSEPNGLCYIETAELDGETNLKCRQCLLETAEMGQDDARIGAFNGEIVCETPNNLLNKYEGVLTWEGKSYALDNDKVVLRGCVLRNTQWCYGMVIFAGKDTKLMQNSGKTKFKRTSIDRLLNFIIIGIVFFLLSMCLFCTIACGFWETITGRHFQIYLPWDKLVPTDPIEGATVIALLVFFSYTIVLNTVVPISLYVSVEVIRFVQSFLINWDENMYHEKSGTSAKARTTCLNEELGQIEYIFSDKTGTLTQNIMTFNKCSIGEKCYGDVIDEQTGDILEVTEGRVENASSLSSLPGSTQPSTFVHLYNGLTSKSPSAPGTLAIRVSSTIPVDFSENPDFEPEFRFYDKSLLEAVRRKDETVHSFFKLLALCHTVMPDEKSGKLEYQAQSPDEAALVSAARNFGFVFKERSPNSITIDVMGEREVYELLCILDFNNVRKRMSVILRKDGKLRLFCKGADNVIYERLKPDSDARKTKTQDNLNKFASEGLRTLCLAVRDLEDDFFNDWKNRHQAAALSLDNRDEKLDSIYEEIEKDMTLLGATAIEDKLQDGVPQAISKLAQAGIKIWVLTGDKQETAINIGYSCQLLTDDMAEVFIVDGNLYEDVEQQLGRLRDMINNSEKSDGVNGGPTAVSVVTFSESEYQHGCSVEEPEVSGGYALVINGHSLVHALHPSLEKIFLEAASQCKSVICCRVTPLQKAMVVELIKKNKHAVTLAIGDGANDVSMIKAAHIGVGISGQEGLQAVLASDYSLPQFRFLERLLLVHGRWSYFRMCKFLRYFFYKNFAFTLCHFWFAFFCGFSAQTLFDPIFISFYNLFYTALPVMSLGVFDQDVNDKNSLSYPKLYTPGHQDLLFNKKEFLKSAMHGFFTSCILFLVPYGTYIDGVSPKGHALSDHMLFGSVVATILIIVVTAQIALDTAYWTWWSHFTIWGSLCIYFTFTFICNYVFGGPYIGSLTKAMSEPTFWFTTLLTVTILIVPVLAWRFYFVDVKPTLSDRVRLKQRLESLRSRQSQDILRTPSARRTRRSIRSGYAFAHQEGFGRLITSGKIMRKIPRPNVGTDFSFPLSFGSSNLGGSMSPRKPVVASSSSSNAGAFTTLAPPEIPGFNEQS
ncbi:probable phospholipid-transporting ATPase IM isoform X2 [Neocloeon triangulifer]|uniref:probable phospholipid-transporting ATPase IM isoform X2 n=1 Tax=Neocloeon triangulifer TaxID=2078957 RepID=UPI00286F0BE5|nr:probable phospholipid-transporting ATPase IM isoform X2 [Neocloeon triangulifer]